MQNRDRDLASLRVLKEVFPGMPVVSGTPVVADMPITSDMPIVSDMPVVRVSVQTRVMGLACFRVLEGGSYRDRPAILSPGVAQLPGRLPDFALRSRGTGFRALRHTRPCGAMTIPKSAFVLRLQAGLHYFSRQLKGIKIFSKTYVFGKFSLVTS